MPKTAAKKISVLDIPGLSAFQRYHGNTPELIMQGTRVICLFDPNDTFYAISERFNRNEPVNVLDFLNCQRQLRAMMMTLKSGQR